MATMTLVDTDGYNIFPTHSNMHDTYTIIAYSVIDFAVAYFVD